MANIKYILNQPSKQSTSSIQDVQLSVFRRSANEASRPLLRDHRFKLQWGSLASISFSLHHIDIALPCLPDTGMPASKAITKQVGF
jgi:hypothetical protein